MRHTPTILPGDKSTGQGLVETQSTFISYEDEVLDSVGNQETEQNEAPHKIQQTMALGVATATIIFFMSHDRAAAPLFKNCLTNSLNPFGPTVGISGQQIF